VDLRIFCNSVANEFAADFLHSSCCEYVADVYRKVAFPTHRNNAIVNIRVVLNKLRKIKMDREVQSHTIFVFSCHS
jgi:hypothetical protein